jgi:methionine-rich copper-binding protein CopC
LAMTKAYVRTLVVLAALAAATYALAHAHLERATPPPNGSVRNAPMEITILFSENLEGSFSSITVVDASGARVDQGDSRVDSSNRKMLRVTLKALTPGRYRVNWRVLSVDTHKTEGSYNFRVAP